MKQNSIYKNDSPTETNDWKRKYTELKEKYDLLFNSLPQNNYDEVVVIGKFRIEKGNCKVFYDGKELKFVKKEYDLFILLCSYPGKTFTREQILSLVWHTTFIGERTIDTHVAYVNKKIKQLSGKNYIISNPKRGYYFNKPE